MGDTVFKPGERGGPIRPPPDAALPPVEAGRLHEIHAQPDDGAAALAFALTGGKAGDLFLIRMARGRRGGQPYGAGLALLGIDPARLVLIDAPDELALLRAGLDAARCPGAGTVILEAPGRLPRYDLPASRRLALAAGQSQSRVIVLRGDAEPRPSAAQTRWRVKSAPSIALEAQAPGGPAIDIELLRWRGGPAGRRWRLEWDGDSGTFRAENLMANLGINRTAPIPGAVVPFPLLRTG